MTFADTNWLEALYFDPRDDDQAAALRKATVLRFMRTHSGRLGLCAVAEVECRNVFSRTAAVADPAEWHELQGDKGGLLLPDVLNWDLTRRDAFDLFARYSAKVKLGTFDVFLFCSARLAGCTRLLTFDDTLAALAVAEGVDVFPPLSEKGKALLRDLRTPAPTASPRSSGSN